MGLFERYLSLWIALAIVVGVVLGGLLPDLAAWIASLEVARINLPIAVLIWGMIVPMMLAVDFSAIGGMREQPRGAVDHCGDELVDQAAHDDGFGLGVHPWRVRGLDPGSHGPGVCGRHDSAGGGSLHRDGVCVESPQ